MPLDQTDVPDWARDTTQQPPPPPSAATTSASPDQVPDWAQDTSDTDQFGPTSSAGGAFMRRAGEAAIPTAAGVEAAIPAAEAGAALGTAVAPGPGTLIGGIAGGLAGAAGAGWLASKGQDWILDKLGLREHLGLDDAQRQADTAHPVAEFAGSMLPALLTMRADKAATLGQRAISGAIMGGQEAGQEYENEGDVSLGRVGAMAAAGAALPAIKKPSTMIAEAMLRRGTGTGAITPPPQTTEGAPGRPDIGGTPSEGADKEDIQIANDITTTSRGVAAENPPAPEVEGAGNPVGAPMWAREAADPGDPTRDYRKEAAAAPKEGVTTAPSTEGVTLSDNPIHEDVAAAIQPEQGEGIPDFLRRNPDNTFAQPTPPRQPEQLPIQTGLAEAAGSSPKPPEPVPAQPEPGGTAGEGGNDVTATVTPREQQVIDATTSHLEQAAKDDPNLQALVERFKQLPPQEQALSGTRLLQAIQNESKETTAKAPTEARMPYARPKLEGGPMARSKGDAAKKQAALDAIKGAVTQFASDKASIIPTSQSDKANLIDRLTKMVKAATDAHNGVDPLTAYKPRVKPPEWQLLNAAKRVVAKPTPANIKAYVSAENILRKGENPEAATQAAKDLQDTSRINADIELRRLPAETASQEAMIAAAKEGEPQARQDFPPFDNSAGEESKVYEAQQNKMRKWLNGLDDVDYRLLANRHPDLATNIETVQDPRKLHTILEGDLEGLKKNRPGVIEAAPGEDMPGKSVPVDLSKLERTPEPIKSKLGGAEAANAGKSRKDLIAEYNAKLAAGELKAKPAVTDERIAAEEAAEANARDDLAQRQRAAPGSWSALADKAKQLAGDESGAVAGGYPMNWLTRKYKEWLDKTAPTPEQEYGEALSDRLHVLSQKHIRDDVFLRANALQTGDYTAREWQDAFRALEKKDRSTLPQPMQDELRDHYDNVMHKFNEVYDEYKELRPGLNLPDRQEGYVPLMRKGGGMDPTKPDENDPLLGIRRGLSADADPLTERKFFTATTPGGKRTVFQPEPNGIRIYVNGKSKHYDVPNIGTQANDPNYVGKQFMLGNQQYTVDFAHAKEIGDNVRDENGKPLQYIENPILTVSNAYKAVKTALDNWKMVQSIIQSKEFQDKTTYDSQAARKLGWEEITLPDSALRGRWAPGPIARTLNDYSRPGFNFDDGGVLRALNKKLTQLVFSTPFPHALNETQLWATQRGFNWLPTNGNYGRLIRTALRAAKSVNEQDYIQDQLAASGASPMLGGVLTRNNMEQIAQKMGLEVAKDAPKFDPIFKTLGVSAGDVVNYWYRNVAQKPMWWWSDFLLTQQFLEHQELGQSLQGAAQKSHEFISDYRVPTAALPGVLPDRVGRLISQSMQDSSVFMFGRYRYGLYKSAANMAMNLAGPNATKAQRVQAAGNLLAMLALGAGVWPIVNKGIRYVTGNPQGELNPAGLQREYENFKDAFGTDADKDLGGIVRGVIQPAPMIQTVTDLANNKDWKGDPIVVRGQTFTPRGAGQLGEFAARQIAPYNTVANAAATATRQGGGAPDTLGRIVAEQLGVKLPSEKAQAYKNRIAVENAKLAKARLKKPGGPIERGINYLTQ